MKPSKSPIFPMTIRGQPFNSFAEIDRAFNLHRNLSCRRYTSGKRGDDLIKKSHKGQHHKGPHHNRYKHGQGNLRNRLYRAWHHIKDDIKNVEVCDDWRHSFETFRDWALSNGYDEEVGVTHFKRRDMNLGWTPSNTYITTIISPNQTFLTYNGVTMNLTNWAKKLGLSKQCLSMRIYMLKWPVERALTEDVHENDEVTFD